MFQGWTYTAPPLFYAKIKDENLLNLRRPSCHLALSVGHVGCGHQNGCAPYCDAFTASRIIALTSGNIHRIR